MQLKSILFTFSLLIFGGGCAANTDMNATTLSLRSLNLESVPSYVFQMTSLQELDLSDNRLSGALPGEIRRLENLRILDVSGNNMTGVPAEIGQLSKLEVLDLSDNELTGFPLELGNLTNLERLNLSGNDVSEVDLEQIQEKLTDTEIITD